MHTFILHRIKEKYQRLPFSEDPQFLQARVDSVNWQKSHTKRKKNPTLLINELPFSKWRKMGPLNYLVHWGWYNCSAKVPTKGQIPIQNVGIRMSKRVSWGTTTQMESLGIALHLGEGRSFRMWIQEELLAPTCNAQHPHTFTLRAWTREDPMSSCCSSCSKSCTVNTERSSPSICLQCRNNNNNIWFSCFPWVFSPWKFIIIQTMQNTLREWETAAPLCALQSFHLLPQFNNFTSQELQRKKHGNAWKKTQKQAALEILPQIQIWVCK